MGGICGMGMSPLASFLKNDGYDVFGYDDAPNADIVEMLESDKIDVRRALAAERFDKLVISTALISHKKEFEEKYPFAEILRRGEAWARLCSQRKLTAIVGSHGKSTVSAMLAHAGLKNKKDFGYLVGAIPQNFPMSRYCARAETLISEIDESDGTIEMFSPEVCVALNADLDHIDTYADNQKLRDMFARLFARTKRAIVYPQSDLMLAELAENAGVKTVAVKTFDDFTKTNIAMAQAAFEATFQEDCPDDSLTDFHGLARRQEIISDTPELFAISDYAHHPHEVSAFLQWLDKKYEDKKTIIFQPHRYTRTKYFCSLFARILDAAAERGNEVLILPVYPASEPFDADGTSERVAEKAPHIKLARKEDFCNILNAPLTEKKRNFIAIVGAGDFHFEAKKIIKKR